MTLVNISRSEKIKYAIYHNPYLIPDLFNDCSIRKGMIKYFLNKTIPCRFGIEFELAGNFAYGFIRKYKLVKPNNINEDNWYKIVVNRIKHKYKLIDYLQDLDFDTKVNFNLECSSIVDNPIVIPLEDHVTSEKPTITEVRISFNSAKSLKGLYDFMNDLSEFCGIHDNGGIHIHVDMSKYFSDDDNRNLVENYINKHLNEVISIFPKYTGKYNKPNCSRLSKKSYVNISRLNTMEFRIAPLTFSYQDLISWISKLSEFRTKVIKDCRLEQRTKIYNSKLDIKNNQDDPCEDIPIDYSSTCISIPTSSRYYITRNDGNLNNCYITPDYC